MITAQLLAAALRAAANVFDGNGGESNAAPVQQAATTVAQTADPLAMGGPVGPSAAAQAATADSIMALIQPHLSHEPTKLAFGEAMRSVGVQNLPEAQPHQYPALYAAFEKVIAAKPAATASPSII